MVSSLPRLGGCQIAPPWRASQGALGGMPHPHAVTPCSAILPPLPGALFFPKHLEQQQRPSVKVIHLLSALIRHV